MGYRDDMEAARQRVEALERELAEHAGTTQGVPLGLEVVEFRRQVTALSDRLSDEHRVHERAEAAAEELRMTRSRLQELEQAMELVQAELQRRRREHESLWRRAALADVRGREADRLRKELKNASGLLEQESRRADQAEVALIRTRMRLSIERTRPEVEDPWPLEALTGEVADLRGQLSHGVLRAASDEELAGRVRKLTLFVADLVWNAPEGEEPFADLVRLLREVGHDLHRYDHVRLGPRPPDAPGLRIAIGPLAVRVDFVRPSDGDDAIVAMAASIADDEPLTITFRRG